MKKCEACLAFILLGHIMLGLIFNVATPIFEAPDEDGHYLFVRYLQVHRALPVQTLDVYGPRAHHPPLYHLLGALASAWVEVDGSAERIEMAVNPHVWFRYDDRQTDNKAMWVHNGPEERWPYQGQALVVHLVRLLSLAFSAAAVWLTFLAAHHLRPGDMTFATLATGLVAFNPMVLFMSGVVQNNTTMLASGAAVPYVLSLNIGRGFTPLRWAWVGVTVSLGVLLQLSALTLAAPIAFVVVYEFWRQRRARTLVDGALGVGVPFALLTGWWFVRNRSLYGDWTGISIVNQMWCCDPVTAQQALFPLLTGLFGRFGQGLMITFPRPIYLAAATAALLGVAGLVKWAWSRQDELEGTSPHLLMWLMHGVTVLGVVGALSVYAVTVAPGLPGRYLFPAYPSLALLLAAGCLAWFRPRWRAWAAGSVVILNVGAALYGLFGLLIPTYAMPRSPTQPELSRMTPLDARISDVARILGYKLDRESVAGDDVLAVTVYWQPQARTDVPYTVFVHLYEPSAGSIAQRDTYPGSGNYATTVWDEGRAFVDTYRLRVPKEAAVSGARILLGLYDEHTMRRLPVTGRDAGPPEEAWVEFGDIQVRP